LIYKITCISKQFWIAICLIAAVLPLSGQNQFKATKYEVRNITIRGNEVISDRRLKQELNLKEKELMRSTTFTRRLIELDRMTIETIYVKQGYLNCAVTDSFAVFQGGVVDIFFTVKEGKQYFLKSIEIQGNQSFSRERLLELLDHKIDAPYNPLTIRDGIKRIRNDYANIGKPLARVMDSLKINHDIELQLYIDENATMRIGAVHIFQNERVKRKTIRREIVFSSGDLFSRNKLESSKKHIFQTGLFSNVNIEITNIDTIDNTLDLNVYVRELDMRHLGLNVGFGQDRGVSSGSEPYTTFNIKGEWINRNLSGRGNRLSTRLSTALNLTNILTQPNTEVEIAYIEPWMFGFRSSNLFRLFVQNQVQDENEKTSYGGEASLIIQPDKRLYFKSGIEMQGIQYIYRVTNQAATQLDKEQERSFKITLRRDYRDNFLFPSQGTVFSFDSKVVGSILGGTQDYYKFETAYSQYFNLFGDVVLAYRGKIGWMDTFPAGQETPAYEKFFLGGETSLRGWTLRRFDPDGDDLKILTNIELRFPLFWLIGAELFIDGGNLAPDISSLLETTYRWDAGFGITIASPLGPIRVDYAKIINPRSKNEIENPWQIHFAIPYAF